MTEAERQKQYRERRALRQDRMRSALKNIIITLGTRDTPMANDLRQLAEQGLGDA